MKKIALNLFLLVLVSPLTWAQSRIGVKVFPEFSSVYTTSNLKETTQSLLAFGGGIQYIGKLFTVIHVESGVYLVNRGMTSDGVSIQNGQGGTIGFGSATYNYQYVSLPLLLRIQAGPIYVAAGPEFDFLTKATTTYDLGFGDITVDDNDAPNYQTSALGQVGVRFKLGESIQFFVEGRANAQISDLYQLAQAPRLYNIGLGTGFNFSVN